MYCRVRHIIQLCIISSEKRERRCMNWRKFVSIQKFRFEQGYSWVGAAGLGFMVAGEMQRHWPLQKIPMYILFPAGILLTWFMGWSIMVSGIYGHYADYWRKHSFKTGFQSRLNNKR